MIYLQQSIVQEVHTKMLLGENNRLYIKRDDLIHKDISGNKWRKLKYSILQAKNQKLEGILTFGGAYSNHLVATAVACELAGLRSVGIVRGDELTSDSNETLKRCAKYGMELHFVQRTEYDWRNEKAYQEQLTYKFPSMYIIPEGGANYLGIIGCQEILKETDNDFDIVVVAQGTTTTSCGIAMSIPEATKLWVVPVLKGYESLTEMRNLYWKSGFDRQATEDWLDRVEVLSEYHFGGYAKHTPELFDFIEAFYTETEIPLDPVYTAKTLFALLKEIEKRKLNNCKILFIHTGGLQGSKAIFDKIKRSIY